MSDDRDAVGCGKNQADEAQDNTCTLDQVGNDREQFNDDEQRNIILDGVESILEIKAFFDLIGLGKFDVSVGAEE